MGGIPIDVAFIQPNEVEYKNVEGNQALCAGKERRIKVRIRPYGKDFKEVEGIIG